MIVNRTVDVVSSTWKNLSQIRNYKINILN